jgi:hypothetical protein
VFDYGVQDLKSTRDGDQFRTNVVVRRYGEATFPVDVLVTFRNGERVTEHWDGKERWKLYAYDRLAPALSAQVDPDRVLLLTWTPPTTRRRWSRRARRRRPSGR